MGFRVVAVNIIDCSLGGPVLNLLRMGKNQNILFLPVYKACVWTIFDKPKKKIRLIDILQKYRTWFVPAKELGWQRKIRTCFWGHRWKHQGWWRVSWSGWWRWLINRGQREGGCYSLGKKSRHWLVEVTDKWGAKRGRMLFSRTKSRHMIILMGSAQAKNSESLNQIFSQSLTENLF